MAKQPPKILQIVPRLPPDIDGVGDYALQIAQQLRDRYQILSEFLVFRPSDRTKDRLDTFFVHRLDTHSVEGLLGQIPPDISTVVLQYSNYPYLLGKLDAPYWLIPAMKALKQRQIRVVVMFHELPTLKYRRICIPSPLQQRVSYGLTQIADAVMTNNVAFQHTLSNWAKAPVHRVLNFSTVGEPSQVKPLSDRDRILIIFGSTDRGRIYRSNRDGVRQICQQLDIHTLYDIGRPVDWDADSLGNDIKVIQAGFMSASEVSDLMATAYAGIFDYQRFPNNLAKSTVYAAYAAHGMLPICNLRPLRPQDGIIPNQHYIDTTTLLQQADDLATRDDKLQTIASNAYAQYRTHTLAGCAKEFATIIQPAARSPKTVALGHD